MKRLSIFILFVLFSVTSYAQSQKSILKAIGAGDVAAVSAYFAEDVELCFFDDQNMYSKSEATTKLKTFFSRHRTQGITIKHEGDNKAGKSAYSIAEMKTSNGPLRVYLFTEGSGSEMTIQELRFTNP